MGDWVVSDLNCQFPVRTVRDKGERRVKYSTPKSQNEMHYYFFSFFLSLALWIFISYFLSSFFFRPSFFLPFLSLLIFSLALWSSKKLGLLYGECLLSRVWCGDYIRRVGLTTGFIGSHTITHNYSVYALQLTTVHYQTCRVFTLYLRSLPVSQYRRISSPATLQLFSEDCCSARTLTRNSRNCPRHLVNSLLRCQLTNSADSAISYIAGERTPKKTPIRFPLLLDDVITGTDPTENAAFPLLRSRLGSDHIENMSRVVCPATVINNVSTVDCWPTACMSQYIYTYMLLRNAYIPIVRFEHICSWLWCVNIYLERKFVVTLSETATSYSHSTIGSLVKSAKYNAFSFFPHNNICLMSLFRILVWITQRKQMLSNCVIVLSSRYVSCQLSNKKGTH
jgi:hypothetical protein